MRVCIVTSTFPRWRGDATPLFVFHLAEDLARLGWQVEVLAPHAPGALRQEFVAGINVTRFRYLWPAALESLCYGEGIMPKLDRQPWRILQVPFLVIGEFVALTWLLITRPCDLVHAHWILPQGLVSAIAGRIRGIAVIVTAHGTDVFGLRGAFLRWLKRFVLRRATAATVNSSAMRRAIEELGPPIADLRTIPIGASVPNGVTAERRAEIRRILGVDGPTVVFVGRLIEQKGAADLLAAAALLRDVSGLRIVIVGDGPDKPGLENLAEQLGITNRVKFVGWLESRGVFEQMAAADIVVGPSRSARSGSMEAQGIVFAEALLVGANVVATRSGGIPDTVIHERTGLLVDERAPDQIAAAIRRLLGDRALAARLRTAGREFALAHLTRDRTAAAFDALYRDVLDARRPIQHAPTSQVRGLR